MTSAASGRTFGAIFVSSNICFENPGTIGNPLDHERNHSRDVRIRLSIVTPGFRRAMPS
jgi:hypothetical protein